MHRVSTPLSCVLVLCCFASVALALPPGFVIPDHPAPEIEVAARSTGTTPCVGGLAGIYPCNEVDLLSHLPLSAVGGGSGSGTDCWGWTDPVTGTEYGIIALTSRTSFVDLSDPANPVYVGNLPSASGVATHRDVKTYQDHAFIVAEASGHGMQVFDLTRLRSVVSPPVTFTADANYASNSAHNIVINEDSGFAYLVGAQGSNSCSGGLHMVDISNPTSPTFEGCFSSDGYTHDAQCVDYFGPDPDHQGKEVCFNMNEDALTIVDVTNKNSPAQLSRSGYPGDGYTHQGWLTDDQRYLLLGDEFDEFGFGHNTKTLIWDVANLDSPNLIGSYFASTPAIDHNMYVKDGYLFQANYTAGLRILDLENVASASLSEVAFFDIVPSTDGIGFTGAWSCYPYFDSGIVVVSGIDQGFFVLMPTGLSTTTDVPNVEGVSDGLRVWPNPAQAATTVRFTIASAGRAQIDVYDAAGRRVRALADERFAPGLQEVNWQGRDDQGRALPAGVYFVRVSTSAGSETQKVTLLR